MALSDEKIKEIREMDRGNLKSFISDAETIRAQALDKIEKEHRDLVEKIQALMDEKGDILRAPMSKAELLEYAKEELKKCRDTVLSLLRTHLEACGKGQDIPFNELAMKYMFSENKAFRLPWLILTDKDIKGLVDGLPEIGITVAERDVKIAAIDEQIAELTAKLNNG